MIVGACVGFYQTLIAIMWLLGSRFLFGNRNFVHVSGTWFGSKCCLERSVQILFDSGCKCRRRLDRWRKCLCLSLKWCCSHSWLHNVDVFPKIGGMSVWDFAMVVVNFCVEFVVVEKLRWNNSETSMEVWVVSDEVIKSVWSEGEIRDVKFWLCYGHVVVKELELTESKSLVSGK